MGDPFDPISYWDKRYRRNNHSGHVDKPREQVIRESEKRGDAIRRFIIFNPIDSILDIGSGDGIQAQYIPSLDYLGLDISEWAIKKAHSRNPNKQFRLLDAHDYTPRDLHLSLDVIQHLPDLDYPAHMSLLFSAFRFVIVAAPSKPSSPDDAPHIFHHEWVFDVPRHWKAVNQTEGMTFYQYDPQ